MGESKDKIQLFKGDCLEAMDKLIEEGIKVDLILCDPPYGVVSCKWDSIIPLEEMWSKLKKLRKNDNTPILLFNSEPFGSLLRVSNIKEYKFDWIWDKKSAGNMLVARYQPLKNTENISVFAKAKPNYYPIFEYGYKNRTKEKPRIKNTDLFNGIKSGVFIGSDKNKPGDARYPKNIIEISKQASECGNLKALHPTQKPIELLEYLINTHSKENDIVLDFTIGSGSTGIACLNTNRKFIGIEKDEKYFETAYNRINEHMYELITNRIGKSS